MLTSTAVPGAKTPVTLDTLSCAFLEARLVFWNAKSIIDLVIQYDLASKIPDGVVFAIGDMVKTANEKFECVEQQLCELRVKERSDGAAHEVEA